MTTKPSAFEELLEGIVWASCSPEAGPGSLAAARTALVSAYAEMEAERDALSRWKEDAVWTTAVNKAMRASKDALCSRIAELEANALTAEEAAAIPPVHEDRCGAWNNYPEDCSCKYQKLNAKLRSISSPQQTLTENR